MKIELLLMDCDGVLTDGRLYFSPAGEAMKVFHVRDGQGIVQWHKAGFLSGIITGRDSENILKIRADELGMRFLRVRSEDKIKDLGSILGEIGLSADQTAYIGDDLGDLTLLRSVGLPIAVADAVPEVIAAAAYVTKANGGYGAVREVIDLLLNAKTA
ncbi:MAG TPA: HAD hydrolase family protein [Pyrinomonadaceae bacterium]|nr:HAD hydrolase family protein [Pyrinomonadaceae bacterium]